MELRLTSKFVREGKRRRERKRGRHYFILKFAEYRGDYCAEEGKEGKGKGGSRDGNKHKRHSPLPYILEKSYGKKEEKKEEQTPLLPFMVLAQ